MKNLYIYILHKNNKHFIILICNKKKKKKKKNFFLKILSKRGLEGWKKEKKYPQKKKKF